MAGGRQEVNLDVNGCIRLGTAIHEILHAVGMNHEHQRYDRDSYIWVYYENVQAGQ